VQKFRYMYLKWGFSMAINNDISPRFVFVQGTTGSPATIQVFSNERYLTFLECSTFSGQTPKICDSLSDAQSDNGYSLVAPQFFKMDLNDPKFRLEDTFTIYFLGEGRVYIQ